MTRANSFSRRTALKALTAGAAAWAVSNAEARSEEPAKVNGNVKQSICRWCYGKIPLEKLAAEAKKMGYQSIELIGPEEYKTVKSFGLTCGMMRCATGIVNGLNRKENHDKIVDALQADIEFAAVEKLPNVLCMAGNRVKGMTDEEALDNCALGLKRILKQAEEKKITVCMEGLNTKVDHKGYVYDRTKWGVDLCKKLGSDRFKLLYDIYHMQIMEGDVIRTIRDNRDFIAHFHTGGNPGRNEIDETQELNYPAIVKAILEKGYNGFLGQEFIPKRDPFQSLAQGFRICDV